MYVIIAPRLFPTKIWMLRYNYVGTLMLNCGYFETTSNYSAQFIDFERIGKFLYKLNMELNDSLNKVQ